MSSGQAQQTVVVGGTTVVAGDAFTVTINNVTYTYIAVAADATAGVAASTVARVAAGLNATGAFASLYTAFVSGANPLAFCVAANSFGDTRPAFSCAYSGSGNATLTASGSQLIGGDGGAATTVQSTGGAASPGASGPPVVAQGGFIAQIGTTYTKNGVG